MSVLGLPKGLEGERESEKLFLLFIILSLRWVSSVCTGDVGLAGAS